MHGKPGDAQPFILSGTDFIHVGDIVFFGLAEEAYRALLLREISRINDHEMDIPALQHLKFDFGHAAQYHLDKVLVKLFVQGTSPEGQTAYAYGGVRGDVLEKFLASLSRETDIAHFATILACGEGELSGEDREYMAKTHRFEEREVHTVSYPSYDGQKMKKPS